MRVAVRPGQRLPPEETQKRRKKVLALCNGERTIAQIAEAVGATRTKVARDIEALRLAGKDAPTRKPGWRLNVSNHDRRGPKPKPEPIPYDVVVYADGSRLTVSHGVSAESARRMALAMSRGRQVVSHTVEAA